MEKHLVAALSRRVHDDNVRADTGALVLGGYDFFGFAHVEGDVVHLVEGGVAAGVIDGFFDDFHAVDLFCLLSQEERDGSDAAVKIPDDFFAFQPSVLKGFGIKNLRLRRVDLEEGKRPDLIANVSDIILDIIFPPEGLAGRAEDAVGLLFVGIDHDTGHTRNGSELRHQNGAVFQLLLFAV